jgi:hypothetical protein
MDEEGVEVEKWYEQVDRMRDLEVNGRTDRQPPAFGKGLLRFWKFDKDCEWVWTIRGHCRGLLNSSLATG